LKYRLMDLLACPIDKTFPLKLIVLRESEASVHSAAGGPCELYCGRLAREVKPSDTPEALGCSTCMKTEVEEGVLYCTTCSRWYPILEGIPRLLPDQLRDREEDLKFLRRFKDRLPREVVEEGRPYNLSGGKEKPQR